MKKNFYFFFVISFASKVNSQISPNKAFDTLKESIKVSVYDRTTRKILSSDHHYCTIDNKEFMVNFGFTNSFWPFRFEDPIVKATALKLDHLKFAKLGYLPLLYELKRPVYNKKVIVFLEKMKKDSIYEMENIIFKEDLSVDEAASNHSLHLYKTFLLEKQPRLKIEIKDIRSPNVKSEDDKKKAAANLKKLLGAELRINIKIECEEKKEINNMVEFKVLTI